MTLNHFLSECYGRNGPETMQRNVKEQPDIFTKLLHFTNIKTGYNETNSNTDTEVNAG